MTNFDDAITVDNSNIKGITSSKLININTYPVKNVINILLQDKTTKKNIIWATDSYFTDEEKHKGKNQIKPDDFFTGIPVKLEPRNKKDSESQIERTRKKAEVFTPLRICNFMNNQIDESWFGYSDVFNHIDNDQWTINDTKVIFPQNKKWEDYIDSRRIEITCGEAPFIVSRYDAYTGEVVFPLNKRIGLLDRKLRIVNENTTTLEEWIKWTIRSFQSCYGFEWQGDNLLIARINLLLTFYEYYKNRWNTNPDIKYLKQISNIISWNFWQMDGLTDSIPFGKPYQEQRQLTLFDSFSSPKKSDKDVALPCKIYDWRRDNSLQFKNIKKVGNMSKKLFDFVIGNPPYQQEFSDDGNKTYAAPVYPDFMDNAYKIGDIVELIHPARFLFDAGSTPKAWNRKMLNDCHFKVLAYEPDSKKIFDNEVTGGIAISYYDNDHCFSPIEVFTQYSELNSILDKVTKNNNFRSIENEVVSRTAYRLSEKLHQDYPEAINQLTDGHAYDMASNIFEKLPQVFYENKPENGEDYVKMFGRKDGNRGYMFIKREYINDVSNLDFYKIVLARADGASGTIGKPIPARIIGTPVIEGPHIGTTESFLSIGAFVNAENAENALKYVKTKFCRTLLGVLKLTQDITPGKWKYVPTQDFTTESDIDWTKSINDIDKQLYLKYGLSSDEIEFIDKYIQEMN